MPWASQSRVSRAVHPVPGHTEGSVLYLADATYCFSGDSVYWSRTLRDVAASLRLPVDTLAERAGAADTKTRYETLSQEAIDRGIFGVPTYVVRGEMFWGQDRLDFLGRALAQ